MSLQRKILLKTLKVTVIYRSTIDFLWRVQIIHINTMLVYFINYYIILNVDIYLHNTRNSNDCIVCIGAANLKVCLVRLH